MCKSSSFVGHTEIAVLSHLVLQCKPQTARHVCFKRLGQRINRSRTAIRVGQSTELIWEVDSVTLVQPPDRKIYSTTLIELMAMLFRVMLRPQHVSKQSTREFR